MRGLLRREDLSLILEKEGALLVVWRVVAFLGMSVRERVLSRGLLGLE